MKRCSSGFKIVDSATPYYGVQKGEVICEAIASTNSVIVAGRIRVGLGAVYFASLERGAAGNWSNGADRARWTLNFRQWMIDLPVPGAAQTRRYSFTTD